MLKPGKKGCSRANRVMLRRHSSSQVLPSGSKRLWWKMLLWSHRNIHRHISSKSTQVNPGVAVTHNPYGYSSDTLEPKHKQSPRNVEWYPRDGKLFVSVVSVESGKAIAKSSKVLVQYGSCQWSDSFSEFVLFPGDNSSKEIDECLLKLIVAMGPSRSSILGEVTVNMASYVSSNAESPLSLKLETWMVVLLWLVTLGFNCSQLLGKSNIGNLEYIAEY
ncbi:hypothetical protein HN51_054517 [Arachis hypogaea]